ncbi:LemA family protein [uncultured archaeon]|nr:LemA family protein [uncultured archaeon]
MSSSKNDDIAFAIFGALAGIGAYMWGLGQYRLKKVIEYTPTSKAIAVAPGIAEVSGKAEPSGALLTSPYDHKQCVYYENCIYKWSGSGKHRTRDLVKMLQSEQPFYLEDDTGRVLVNATLGAKGGWSSGLFGDMLSPKSAETKDMVGWDRQYSATPKRTPLFAKGPEIDANLQQFLTDHEPSLLNYDDKVDVEERYIEPGDQIFMIGTASETEFEGRPQMVVGRSQKGGAFCIADGTEKKVLSSLALWPYVGLVLGPVLFALCTLYLGFRSNIATQTTMDFISVCVAAMYAYLAYVLATEFVNGMILLRNSVGRAQANVDALLKRRHDLIENLVTVVSAAAKYEKKLDAEIAKIRAEAAQGGSKQLLMIAEGYPNLQANQNFMSLQQELSRTEEWIAGSRSYVADSIMLYNTRIGTFPYLLIAPIMGLKPISFEAATA